MSITWVMPGARRSTAYYYTATYLNDLAVARHSRIALKRIADNIRAQNPQYGNGWELAYLISKPLDFLNQPVYPAVTEAVNEDEEDVEDEEDEDEEDVE
eukprot:CAMPEP_0196761756 /NCGR_PEP_ID=MMETSP1095-20130614/1059_1 /TAXON_ID=96789 ORGANISM="Chromulina nebulosa, Strain UTEXLB2642" /NCGR_SAMPLE_ID=MMETSP1095 /ASSEMBLY_ACC=CAM_ASM_000446 /LENGTH=98 /DNA_ID=CAMNT_0042111689 /DNA_START=262 /DNA_END=558 /DNA_ORIENTATION=-